MRYLRPGTAILVTGATGGIGYEVARHAAEDGAVVGVHGSRQESVDSAIARIRESVPDAKLVGLPANFQDDSTIAPMVDKFAGEAGRLDALVHCAITGAPGTQGLFRNTRPEAYARNAALVLATFQQLAFAAYQHMMKQEEGGTIVAYISDAARYPAAHQTMLGSVFGGIIAFVRNLGFEGARDRVRAHVVSPSYVKETPVFERFGVGGRGETAEKKAGLGLPTPRDLAPLTLFLCGPDATRMTGQVLSVNGGINT
jgi:3-oxoacyl-[acyl-carrier protein] reductase